jgi:CheY-like chemotaxis protein
MDLENWLQIGNPVILRPGASETDPRTLRMVLRGWNKCEYLLLEKPDDVGRGVNPLPGASCELRFIWEGDACSFKSRFIDRDKIGHTTCWRIAWPDSFRMATFRKHPRVKIDAACEVLHEEMVYEGKLCDISVGGFAMMLHSELSGNQTLELSMELPGLTLTKARALVRNSRASGTAFILGCEFAEGQEEMQTDIAFFVESSLNRSKPARQRILVIDESDERRHALVLALRPAGVDVFATGSLMGGLVRISSLAPQGVLVSASMRDMSPAALLHIIHNTPALGQIPVFFYCGREEDREEALVAGAKGYFVEGAADDTIRTLVDAVMHAPTDG